MDRIGKSIDALMETYRSCGMVNHSGGANLPGRENIIRIVRGLEELLFPGYRENQDLDHRNLRLITAEKVNCLARELIREVEKSLAFSVRDGSLKCGSGGCHAAAEMLVENFFEEAPVGNTADTPLDFVDAPRRPGMDGRVYVAEGPLIGR